MDLRDSFLKQGGKYKEDFQQLKSQLSYPCGMILRRHGQWGGGSAANPPVIEKMAESPIGARSAPANF